jgi:hypothetical protein
MGQLLRLPRNVEPAERGARLPVVRLTLPDGTVVTSEQPDLEQTLSRALGLARLDQEERGSLGAFHDDGLARPEMALLEEQLVEAVPMLRRNLRAESVIQASTPASSAQVATSPRIAPRSWSGSSEWYDDEKRAKSDKFSEPKSTMCGCVRTGNEPRTCADTTSSTPRR